MATVADSLGIQAIITWEQQTTNDDFAVTRQGPDRLLYSAEPSASTYTQVLVDEFTLAAAATQTVNLNAFTSLLNQAVTGMTKVLGILIKATGSGGAITVEPGASNGINFWFGDTITLTCGTNGCAFLLADGAAQTISAAIKNIDITNSGAATITVQVAALVGP